MAKSVKRTIKSGRWVKTSFVIKKRFRKTVVKMADQKGKTLFVRQQIRSRKIGKRSSRKVKTAFHRYIVRST